MNEIDILMFLTRTLFLVVALCSLNIECCFITSRTIRKVADSLDAGSVLEQLCIGNVAYFFW